jgi:hypothetical protein
MNAQRLRVNLAIIALLERMWMGADDDQFIDSELLGTWFVMLAGGIMARATRKTSPFTATGDAQSRVNRAHEMINRELENV